MTPIPMIKIHYILLPHNIHDTRTSISSAVIFIIIKSHVKFVSPSDY